MKLKKLTALVLLLSLCLALAACGAEESPVSDAPAADDGLVDYTVEGVGTFRLPEGFEMETGSTTEPLPTNYVVFEKDGVTISCSRFGKDAYEAAGVPLPADVEEYSTPQRRAERRARGHRVRLRQLRQLRRPGHGRGRHQLVLRAAQGH